LISNTCEENEKYGICYLGDSAGTAEGNTCRANKENEIFLYDNANPILLNNIGDDGNEDFGYRIPKRIK
jgi:parallel beta-helix repeat protein